MKLQFIAWNLQIQVHHQSRAELNDNHKNSKSRLCCGGCFSVAGVDHLTAVFQHQFNLSVLLQFSESLPGQSNSNLHSLRHHRGSDEAVIGNLLTIQQPCTYNKTTKLLHTRHEYIDHWRLHRGRH